MSGELPAMPVRSTASAPHYRRILVAFDDSEASRHALEEAAALARGSGATLELFALFDSATHVSGFEPVSYAVDEVIPRARARLAEALASAVLSAQAGGARVVTRLVDGETLDLPTTIARRVAETKADLVVVGTHGRRGWDRFLLGSVAEAIERKSPVPVLLVRTPDV